MQATNVRPEERDGARIDVRAEETYRRPTVEVICLDCEISSYAPDDGDVPLF